MEEPLIEMPLKFPDTQVTWCS